MVTDSHCKDEGGSSISDVDSESFNQMLNELFDNDMETDPLIPPNSDSSGGSEYEGTLSFASFMFQGASGSLSHSDKLRRASESSTSSTATLTSTHDLSAGQEGKSRPNSLASVSSFRTAIEGGEHEEREDDGQGGKILHTDPSLGPYQLTSSSCTAQLGLHELNSSSQDDPKSPTKRGPVIGPTLTTSLASSLISTIKGAFRAGSEIDFTPDAPDPYASEAGLHNAHMRLGRLFESLANVCISLQDARTTADRQEMVGVLARRLNAARRVLDGEFNL